MIVTVTLNPSLDYIVTAGGFRPGQTNRTTSELILPGGKGINVSIVLKALGKESTALGFTAGFVGAEICRKVKEAGIHSEFIELKEGCSRINIKFKDIEGTELNGMGPEIGPGDAEKLFGMLDRLTDGDALVLSGSVPKSMPEDTYRRIMERLEGRGILIAVDAAGRQLESALSQRPFLIKPNRAELGELFSVEAEKHDDAIPPARKLQEAGARNVMVSMGGLGAVLLAENGDIYTAEVPAGTPVSTVGAGDSMVAGFLAGWLENRCYKDAFRLAVAAGSASAYSDRLAAGPEVRAMYEKVRIKQLVSF